MNFLKEVWKEMKIDWFGMILYGVFGFVLSFGGIGVLEQPLCFFTLLGILIVVDIRAHNHGLDRGVEIVKNVWDLK